MGLDVGVPYGIRRESWGMPDGTPPEAQKGEICFYILSVPFRRVPEIHLHSDAPLLIYNENNG